MRVEESAGSEASIVHFVQSCMEQVVQKTGGQEDEWCRRMGGEERTHSGFIVDNIEFAEERSGSNVCPEGEELGWFLVTEDGDSVFTSDQLRSQSQWDDEMRVDSEENEEAESGDGDGVEVDEREMQSALEVFLWPIERSGGHVRISLEEVQSYYRFSRCCHWLCGMCMIPAGITKILPLRSFSQLGLDIL